MLTLVALGLLMGGRDMLNIWRRAAKLDERQRAAIDPKAYATALTGWLQANTGILPRSPPFDGKSIGDCKCGMIITLCRHEDGRPVAMIPATGDKEDSEVNEARALLADPQVRLENALITADPLHNKEATLRVIVEKGGDYLIGTVASTSPRTSR
jgi:hypothetical protein